MADGYALPGGPLLEGSGEKGGYDPQDLQSAYRIPTSGGAGQTIAVVDAYGYAAAESDLAHYRERYGLPPCAKATGCFRKVNQHGEEGGYPGGEGTGWEAETALDLDMASAACPGCQLLLVQASGELAAETGEAVNTAARLGASEISNSYGYPEDYEPWCGRSGCSQYSSDYDHPGVVVTASAGDSGYDNHFYGLAAPSFPASSPYVVAVGGTSLHRSAGTRGWSEEVWDEPGRAIGTGGGCSLFEPKPTWQTDGGCPRRTDNDVAADGACETAVSVYTSYYGGWEDLCGTSASSPLVAGMIAHESESLRALGADAFYQSPGSLYDVTLGANGTCTPPAEDEYLCHAVVGYDGPTGVGTPQGAATPPTVTDVEPREGPASGGTQVTITGTGFAGVSAVRFGGTSASAYTVNSPTSITAASPPGEGSIDVTVTTTEGTSQTGSEDQFAYTYNYPELGRCRKVAKGAGRYGTATCISPLAGGSFEWTPGAVKAAFTGKGGTSKLETVGKVKVECTAESDGGSYVGTSEVAGLVLTLTGCQMPKAGACASAGAPAGELVTSALDGTFVWESRPARKAALDVYPVDVAGPVVQFQCGTVPVEVRGSLLAAVPDDKMLVKAADKYAALRGVQKPSEYETAGGRVLDVLEASILAAPFQQAALTVASDYQTSEEALELNAYA